MAEQFTTICDSKYAYNPCIIRFPSKIIRVSIPGHREKEIIIPVAWVAIAIPVLFNERAEAHSTSRRTFLYELCAGSLKRCNLSLLQFLQLTKMLLPLDFGPLDDFDDCIVIITT
jgi:hypothetical protein